MTPKVLLLGKDGQIGWELKRFLSQFGQLHALGSSDLDLSDLALLRETLHVLKPRLIINSAAYTDVEGAEREPSLAYLINAEVPRLLAVEAARLSALLVHYSTDFVFDGKKRSPYTEDDPPFPINQYGRSKQAGENAVLESGARSIILRVGWVYGARRKNFLTKILKKAIGGEILSVVNDQYGTPTWSRAIAQCTSQIIEPLFPGGSLDAEMAHELGGVYNLSSSEEATWYDFAEAILSSGAVNSLVKDPKLKAISSEIYRADVARPAYSVLSNSKLRSAFGVDVASWRSQLQSCLQGVRSFNSASEFQR